MLEVGGSCTEELNHHRTRWGCEEWQQLWDSPLPSCPQGGGDKSVLHTHVGMAHEGYTKQAASSCANSPCSGGVSQAGEPPPEVSFLDHSQVTT